MRWILFGLALALAALPAWAQAPSPEWERCSGTGSGAAVPPEARVGHCTQLIQSGRLSTAELANAYYYRANAQGGREYDQAIADYTQAIKIKPDFPAAFFERGANYVGKRLFDQAIADYTQAIKLKPDYASAYNYRAWAYHRKGEDANGLPDAEKAVTLAPNDGDSIETRGEIYEQLGRRDQALADYRRALQLDPNNGFAKQAMARLGVAP